MRSTQDRVPLLSWLPPSPRQMRACIGVAFVLLAASLATIPFASLQLPETRAFIPIVDTALILGDLITASLLFAQFSVQRSRALLALASGYLFTGLIMIPHLLTFPGVFSATGLLGAGFNTTIWLYYFWHFGLPLAVIGYALWKDPDDPGMAPARASRAALIGAVGIALLVLVLTVFTTAGHAWLPSMMSDTVQWSAERLRIVAIVIFALLGTAMTLVWRRRRSVLDLWLLVSMWAWLIELVMVTFTSTRYSLLWFSGRLYGLLAGIYVLLMLLWESNRLYAQLALAAVKERHEREGRFATMEALSAAIDHEIRQPLGAVVANANAGRRWLTRTPPELTEAKQSFEAISADGHRAAEVIRSIRAIFSRREQSESPIVVDELVRETLLLVADELRGAHIALELDLSPGLAVVGDPGQLKQVLLNLFRNAADAMQTETGREALLRVSCSQHETRGVRIAVTDNGPGIPLDIAERIFDPFFTTKKKGMGMGLAICRSIVEEHGGQLEVAPASPHGSEFRIVLRGVM